MLTPITEIVEERQYQIQKRGGDFDSKNTLNDWSAYITRYLGNATFADTPHEARRQMVKVAALALAAIESYDRNGGFPKRHYDSDPTPLPPLIPSRELREQATGDYEQVES